MILRKLIIKRCFLSMFFFFNKKDVNSITKAEQCTRFSRQTTVASCLLHRNSFNDKDIILISITYQKWKCLWLCLKSINDMLGVWTLIAMLKENKYAFVRMAPEIPLRVSVNNNLTFQLVMNICILKKGIN